MEGKVKVDEGGERRWIGKQMNECVDGWMDDLRLQALCRLPPTIQKPLMSKLIC